MTPHSPMSPLSRMLAVCAALLAATLCAGFAACLLGSTPMSPDRALAALFGAGDPVDVTILREIRLPRTLCAWAAGAALGLAGAGLQGLLRNPLAEPGVLGVSAFASLGAVVAVYFGLAAVWPPSVPVFAIGCAMAATALLALAAAWVGSVATLILVGVGLSSIAGALMSLVLNLAPNPFSLADMFSWLMGSVANRSLSDLALAAPFAVVGAVLVGLSARSLSLLTLGEEAAAGTGLAAGRTRALVVAGTGLLAGASVSLAGAIGFVGIGAPHLVRPLVGHDPGRSLAPSALAGGLLLVIADLAVRLIPTATELRLGVIAALAGAPLFILAAVGRRGEETA